MVRMVVVDGLRLVQKSGNQLKRKQSKAAAEAGRSVDNQPSCNIEIQMKNIFKNQILREVSQVK